MPIYQILLHIKLDLDRLKEVIMLNKEQVKQLSIRLEEIGFFIEISPSYSRKIKNKLISLLKSGQELDFDDIVEAIAKKAVIEFISKWQVTTEVMENGDIYLMDDCADGVFPKIGKIPNKFLKNEHKAG